MPSSNNENGKSNNNNNNNNSLESMNGNNNNNDPGNVGNNAAPTTGKNNNNNRKSASSAEGTRRVKPGTGKAKSRKEIGFAVNMKHAKKTLNNALGIKSMPPEFNPLIKIMKATYNDEASKKAAVNAYIEKIRKAREEKTAARAAKKATTTTVKKPRKAKVTANTDPTASATPAGNGAPASTTAKRSKREAPTEKEGKLKENQLAAKKRLNNALGIKSMPPEFLPIMTIMRKTNISESEKQKAINAQIEKVRKARNEKAATKAAKKTTAGGSRTRKNRRS